MQPRPLPPRCKLPDTCPENRRQHYTHIRLLHSVTGDAWSAAGFDGTLFRAGASVSPAQLGENPVLLEFAGPQGKFRPGSAFARPHLWILWRRDQEAQEWREIARALAHGFEWSLVLREPAIRALHAESRDVEDFALRGREVTAELLVRIDSALSVELPEVRLAALASLYDQMAGRIVAA